MPSGTEFSNSDKSTLAKNVSHDVVAGTFNFTSLTQMAAGSTHEMAVSRAGDHTPDRFTRSKLLVDQQDTGPAAEIPPGCEPRPCIGIATTLTQTSSARLVPYDLTMMARYLGAPLESWPGLAAVCRAALYEPLPPGWREVDPRSYGLSAPATAMPGGNGLVYWHEASGRILNQHPRDPFYRRLVLWLAEARAAGPDTLPKLAKDEEELLLPKAKAMFSAEILQFNVTNTSTVEQSFFYSFGLMKELDLQDAVESAGNYAEKDGEVIATTVASIKHTVETIKKHRQPVERRALRVINQCYRYYRTRKTLWFAGKFLPIRRNVLIRRLQLAVRRRWLRLKLLAWEAHRLRKIYWRVWWDGLIQSPGFRLTMRRVRAGSTVAVEAGGQEVGVSIGPLGIRPADLKLFAAMELNLRLMRERLADRGGQQQHGRPDPGTPASSMLGGGGGSSLAGSSVAGGSRPTSVASSGAAGQHRR